MAQQRHHDNLSQHTSQYSCSNDAHGPQDSACRRTPARQAGSRRSVQLRHQRSQLVAATIPEAASDSSAVEGPAPAAESTATQQLPPKRPDHHVAPGSLADHVPQRAWTVFGNTVGSLLSRIITTTATNLAKATGSLFCLPKDTLSDRKGRDHRVRARCARIQAGEALEPTPPAPPRTSLRAPDPYKALPEAIHRNLHRGSVKKAARRPNAEPLSLIHI